MGGELSQQPYILRLPATTAQRVFEVRLSMLDLKVNHKNKYKHDLTCRICRVEDETLEHIF